MMMRSALFGRLGNRFFSRVRTLDDLLIRARCELSSLVMQRPFHGMLCQPVSHGRYGPLDLPKRFSSMHQISQISHLAK